MATFVGPKNVLCVAWLGSRRAAAAVASECISNAKPASSDSAAVIEVAKNNMPNNASKLPASCVSSGRIRSVMASEVVTASFR